jgi:hypothetical protein
MATSDVPPSPGRSRRRAHARLEDKRSNIIHRPALQRLTLDVKEIRQELLGGFPDRASVLWWTQRVAIRTLGTIPDRLPLELARQFRLADDPDTEPALLSALLDEYPDRVAARETRERLWATIVRRAFHQAFRNLRPDAGEYFDDEVSADPGHDPEAQPYVAMRPVVDELEGYQQRALADLLDGFPDRGEILAWGDRLEQVTHGEIPEAFVTRCYTEPSTRNVLLGMTPGAPESRELFAATYLLPAFTAGVRDLSGRAGEQPDTETEREDPLNT